MDVWDMCCVGVATREKYKVDVSWKWDRWWADGLNSRQDEQVNHQLTTLPGVMNHTWSRERSHKRLLHISDYMIWSSEVCSLSSLLIMNRSVQQWNRSITGFRFSLSLQIIPINNRIKPVMQLSRSLFLWLSIPAHIFAFLLIKWSPLALLLHFFLLILRIQWP